MLDRGVFLRPIAHRGLHQQRAGIIENTAAAFAAAMDRDYGIECDLRPASCGTPLVFHDATLERLIDAQGQLRSLPLSVVRRLTHRGQNTPILLFAELLDLVSGRVPMVVEIKSDWEPVDPTFLSKIAGLACGYAGPIALMSFDPAVMAAMRELAPRIPRGIVAGSYETSHWWPQKIGPERAHALTHLLESGPCAPSFFAYHVPALPTPVTRFAREVMGLPLFAWTVRTPEDWARAAQWADAPIFEGFDSEVTLEISRDHVKFPNHHTSPSRGAIPEARSPRSACANLFSTPFPSP